MKRTIPTPTLKVTLTPGNAVVGQTRMVPVDQLQVLDNLNLRVEGTQEFEDGLTELGASIVANGFYPDKPLAGFLDADDRIIVIDGHRRLAAVRRVNDQSLDGPVVTDLPVVIRDGAMADLTIAMIQSASGAPLTMFEKGIGVRRLLGDGLTKEEIARRLGVSEKSVDNYLLVASAPAKARDMLLDGKVTSTQILRGMTKPDKIVEKLSAAVAKAEGKGRKRARPSDVSVEPVAPPTVDVFDTTTTLFTETPAPEPTVDLGAATDSFTVTIVKDGEMGSVLRSVAQQIRDRISHDPGETDAAHVNATVTVTVSLSKPTPAPRSRKRTAAPVVDMSDTL